MRLSLYLRINVTTLFKLKMAGKNHLCAAFKRYRRSQRRCSVRKVVLRNFAKFIGKHLCQSLFFNIKLQAEACIFIKKETLAQVFSCEFCEISKNIFFTEHLGATASKDTQGRCAIAKIKFGNINPLAYGHSTWKPNNYNFTLRFRHKTIQQTEKILDEKDPHKA